MANYRVALSNGAAVSWTDATPCVLWTSAAAAAVTAAFLPLGIITPQGAQWSGVAYNSNGTFTVGLNIPMGAQVIARGATSGSVVAFAATTANISAVVPLSLTTLGNAVPGLSVLVPDPTDVSGAWRLGNVTVEGSNFLVGSQMLSGTTRVSVATSPAPGAGVVYSLGAVDSTGAQWFNLAGTPTARGTALTTFAAISGTTGLVFAETTTGMFTAVNL